MLWQHFSSLPRDIEYQAGEKQHEKWGTMSRQLTFGEKILSAKGMSCPGHNSTARHCLRTLSLAQQDSQHPPRMKIQPAAACPGQVPRHAQPCPCPPTTCWQLDSRSYFCWFPGHADPTLGTAPCLQMGCTTLHQASCRGTDGDWPCKNLPKCP